MNCQFEKLREIGQMGQRNGCKNAKTSIHEGFEFSVFLCVNIITQRNKKDNNACNPNHS